MFKFEEQICDFEEDLANDGSTIPDETRDSILAAIGKAKLLISQKFVQFRGLCDKNIVSSWQCDQIEKLVFQYLAIYYNENMPNGQTKFPNDVQKLAKY